MAENAELVIQIRATTELLKQQMLQAERTVEGSTRAIQRDLAKFDASFSAIGKSAGSLTSVFKTAGIAAAGFIGAVGIGTLVSVAKEALDYAGSLGEASQALGVGTKFLQEFRYAATQNGASVEQADNALGKLSVTLGQAFTDSSSRAAKSLEAIGLNLDTLRNADDSTRFTLIADAIAKIPDPAQRASAAVSIFGKGAREIIPTLEAGAKGFKAAAAEAQQFGLVLSDDQIQNADKTADKIDALQRALSAKIAGVVADNADSIGYLVNKLFNLVDAAGQATNAYRRYQLQLGRNLAQNTSEGFFNSASDRANAKARVNKFDEAIYQLDNPNSVRSKGGLYNAAAPAAREGRTSLADEARAAARNVSGGGGGGGGGRPKRSSGGSGGGAGGPRKIKEDADDAFDSAKRLRDLLADIDQNFGRSPRTEKQFLTGDTGAEQIKALTDAADNHREVEEQVNSDLAEDYARKMQDKVNLLSNVFEDLFSGNIDNIFQNFERKGLQVVAKVAAQFALSLFDGEKGSANIGSLLSSAIGSIFGGGFASGGTPPMGKISLVGEKGPELFVPKVPGTIISNDNLRGGGGNSSVSLTVNAPGATAETVTLIRRELANAAPYFVQAAKAETLRSSRRQGL